MLAFTPEVRDLLEWFRMTYTVDVGFGWAHWRRASLPYHGGLADQPATLIDALDYIARVRNALLTEDRKRSRPNRREKRTRRG